MAQRTESEAGDGSQEQNAEVAETEPAAPTIKAVKFSYDKLAEATKNFATDIVRYDSRGMTFEGELCIIPLIPQVVAIQLLNEQVDIQPDFMDEVQRLDRRSHENLISLVGYCNEGGAEVFVSDYIPFHFNLYNLLHVTSDNLNCHPSWKARINIAIGVARALKFLHHEADPKGVYGHLTSSNVLVHEDIIKLADVRNLDAGDEPGYNAPEYAPGNQTAKTEVYSYGVLVLEMVTRQKPYDENRGGGTPALLIDAIRSKVNEGEILDILDPSLEGRCCEKSVTDVVRLAWSCVADFTDIRPTMEEMLAALESVAALVEESGEVSGVKKVEDEEEEEKELLY